MSSSCPHTFPHYFKLTTVPFIGWHVRATQGKVLDLEIGHITYNKGCIAAQEQALCVYWTLVKRVWQVEPLFLSALYGWFRVTLAKSFRQIKVYAACDVQLQITPIKMKISCATPPPPPFLANCLSWGRCCVDNVNFLTNKSPQTYLSLQVQDKYRWRRHLHGEKSSRTRSRLNNIWVYCKIWVTWMEYDSLPSSSFLLSSTLYSQRVSLQLAAFPDRSIKLATVTEIRLPAIFFFK